MKTNTIEKSKNLIYEHCDKLTDNLNSKIKEVDNLKETNEILRDKVKHLESFMEMIFSNGSNWMDSKLNENNGFGKTYFEAYNHITKKNQKGNLITYSTK